MQASKNAACAVMALAFLAANVGVASAHSEPIPGVDIIVKKKPGGVMIRVGDCQAGGGHVVKLGGKWVCTGMSSIINTTRSNIKYPSLAKKP